jgi:hypothetical protein
MNKTVLTILITALVTYMLHSQLSQLPLVNKLPSV